MICPKCRSDYRPGIEVCPSCEVGLVDERFVAPREAPRKLSREETRPVVVHRTRQLFEADMVAAALEDAEVPFRRRQQTAGGLNLTVPTAPLAGPGLGWTIEVPAVAVEDAEKVLDTLPIERDETPGSEEPDAADATSGGWTTARIVGLVVLAILATGLAARLFRILRHLISD